SCVHGQHDRALPPRGRAGHVRRVRRVFSPTFGSGGALGSELIMTFWTETLGCEIKYYDAGGWRTRVIEAGSGVPVIMMHGLSGHAESFIRNVRPVGDAGFRAMSVDAIGHGFSAKPLDVTYHSPLFVEHLKRLLDAIGAPKAHLVGQSLGGWTALHFAQLYPSRVASIVSVTGAGFLLDDEA